MESSRRWGGYVCPDCRFVFRIPSDHDGEGVVCPGCRRMLRIPGPHEILPPLVVPLRGTAPEEPKTAAKDGNKRRRKKKSRPGESHAWDEDASGISAGSDRREGRQMFWMMIAGASLFLLIVAGVVVAMLRNDAPDSSSVAVPPPAISAAGVAAEGAAFPVEKSDAMLLAEAEPLIRRFLEAGRIEDMLPLVRKPDVAEARMRGHYQDGVIVAPGIAVTDPISRLSRLGPIATVTVRTRDYEERLLSLEETPEGIRIDWESWVGWSEMPWEDFVTSKPESPKVFRLKLSAVEYFNFGFSDDRKWQSYRLESPDGAHAVFGYVEVGTVLASQIRPPPDAKEMAMTLSLKFPPEAAAANQVLIDRIITEGWVVPEPLETP